MDLPINPNPPSVMYIDMNASFARTEQQARTLLRGKAWASQAGKLPEAVWINAPALPVQARMETVAA